jgi:hypothetical protein
MGTIDFRIERDGLDIELEVEYKAHGRYKPATFYKRNGDPGDPAEYPEIELVAARDANGHDWLQQLTDKEFSEVDQKCFDDNNEKDQYYDWEE